MWNNIVNLKPFILSIFPIEKSRIQYECHNKSPLFCYIIGQNEQGTVVAAILFSLHLSHLISRFSSDNFFPIVFQALSFVILFVFFHWVIRCHTFSIFLIFIVF